MLKVAQITSRKIQNIATMLYHQAVTEESWLAAIGRAVVDNSGNVYKNKL